jgi:solute carrier family 25 phosphate transporter 23/24/25/41
MAGTDKSNRLQIAPESAIKFAAYDTLKRLIKGDSDRDIQTWERFLAGSLAGGVSQTTIYPLEVRTLGQFFKRIFAPARKVGA